MNDPRSTPANASVAHVSLQGQVSGLRFVPGERQRVATATADLRRDAHGTSLERQMLFGEPFLVLETAESMCFGIAEFSGYVGYVAQSSLSSWQSPTHRVSARATLAFNSPGIKTPDPMTLSLGSNICISDQDAKFARTEQGQYIPVQHLTSIDRPETDLVSVAERLLGTPYLWGGNSAFGTDCSGLVQIALRACGMECPGDSDQQEDALGTALAEGAPYKRGDLLFWKGHVALVADPETLLHANAHHMAVCHEPLKFALDRILSQGDGPVTSHKRL